MICTHHLQFTNYSHQPAYPITSAVLIMQGQLTGSLWVDYYTINIKCQKHWGNKNWVLKLAKITNVTSNVATKAF